MTIGYPVKFSDRLADGYHPSVADRNPFVVHRGHLSGRLVRAEADSPAYSVPGRTRGIGPAWRVTGFAPPLRAASVAPLDRGAIGLGRRRGVPAARPPVIARGDPHTEDRHLARPATKMRKAQR